MSRKELEEAVAGTQRTRRELLERAHHALEDLGEKRPGPFVLWRGEDDLGIAAFDDDLPPSMKTIRSATCARSPFHG